MARYRRASAKSAARCRWWRRTLAPLPVAVAMLAATVEVAAAQEGAAASSAMAAPAEDSAALVAQILGRPLFTPGRRPPQPPPAPAPAPLVAAAKLTLDWRLAGILMSPGKREALFVRDDVHVAVGQGEDIGGWTLVAIGPDNVQMAGDGQIKLLHPQPDLDAEAAAAKNKKLVLAPAHNLPTLTQTRVAFLAAGKKSMEEEKKRGKPQLHPRGPPRS